MGKTKLSYLGVLAAVLFLGGWVMGSASAAWNDVAASGVANLTYNGAPKVVGVMEGALDLLDDGSATIGFSATSGGPFGDAAASAALLTNAGTVYYKIIGATGSEKDYDGMTKDGLFVIAKLNLSGAALTVDAVGAYDNTEKKPVPAIVANGALYTALASADTVLTYANNKNAGAAGAANPPTVTVTASSSSVNYTGSVSKTFSIDKAAGAFLNGNVAPSAALQAWIDGEKIVNFGASGSSIVAHAPPSATSGVLVGVGGVTGFGAPSYKFFEADGVTEVLAANLKDAGSYKLRISVAEGGNILAGSLTDIDFTINYKDYAGNPLLTSLPNSLQYGNTAVYTVKWPEVVAPGVYGALDSIYNVSAKFRPTADAAITDWNHADIKILESKYVSNNKSAAVKTVTFTLAGADVVNGTGTVQLTFDAKGKSTDSPKQMWLKSGITMLVNISERPLADSLIKLTDYPIVYTGNDVTAEELSKKFIVVLDGQLAVSADYSGADNDYKILAPTLNRKDAGVNQAWIEIEGNGNYTGKAMKAFTIERAPLTVTASVANTKVYNGSAAVDTNAALPGGGANPNAFVSLAFAGLLPAAPGTPQALANVLDYEIRGARYSDSAAGAVCSLTARVALKNSAVGRNYKFAGASPDSVVVKAYGLEIRKRNIDSADVAYVIPQNHYYNGTQRGVAAPALKAPLALGAGGALTVLYRYPVTAVKPDFDTNFTALPKDTSYIPKKAGEYGVWLNVKGSTNLRDTLVELGTYVIKAPAGPDIASPAVGAPELNRLIRQGRSVSLKVSAKSPNGGALSYKWHTVEALGGVPDSARPMNVAGLATTDSVLTVSVSGAVGTSVKYKALVTNTAPTGVQDPRAVASWTETFTVTVDDPPISIVNAKLIVDSAKTWEYTGFPLTPSGDDVKILLRKITETDTVWEDAVEPDQYTLSYAANTNVGTATVRAAALADGKYQGTVSTTFEVARKRFAATDIAYAEERTYTGDTLGAQVRANPPMTGMGAISVRYGASAEPPVNAGAYDVYVSTTGGDNVSPSDGFQYLGAYTIKKLSADTADLNYTNPSSLNHVEGDTAAKYGVGAVTLKVKGYAGALDVLYDGVDEVPVTAGSYTVTVELGGDDNVEPTAAPIVLGVYTIKPKTDAVAAANREIPNKAVFAEASVAPVTRVAATFAAGPSPVSKNTGKVAFFSSKQVKSGSLYVFDAAGNAVAKVPAKQGSGKEIGSWNLKDRKGAAAAEGVYVVKGALVGKDGKREKVSFVFSVVR